MNRQLRHGFCLLVPIISVIGFAAYFDGELWESAAPGIEIPEVVKLTQVCPGRLSVQIPVKNVGHSPLILSHFRKSCGCLELHPVGEGNHLASPQTGQKVVIPPQEGTSLRAVVRIGSQSEDISHLRIDFKTNDPDNPEVSVAIVSKVIQRLFTIPAYIALGPVERETSIQKTIEIYAPESISLDSSQNISVTASENIQLQRLDSSDIDRNHFSISNRLIRVGSFRVSITTPNKPGTFEEKVVFQISSESHNNKIEVPISGTVSELAQVVPKSIIFPTSVDDNLCYQVNCLVHSSKSTPFSVAFILPDEIEMLEGDDTDLSIPSSEPRIVTFSWIGPRPLRTESTRRCSIIANVVVGETTEVHEIPVICYPNRNSGGSDETVD